ncbi:Fur family transcriptional regulator [Anaerosolibacter sp.]|uniref:Fur family transcriptional regulator n=1 Tax=Anaerosolibacter sp. TaxID=1872527 RepID=UPI0039F0D567
MKKPNLKKKLTQNTKLVLQVFQSTPFDSFDVYMIRDYINKDRQMMSQRTIYRAVERLVETGEIVCIDIINGTRKYELAKANYCTFICRKCGKEKHLEIKKISELHKKIYKCYDFHVNSSLFRIYGECSHAC